ncbi:MAG TPA: hypothetical protein VMB53_04865 [Gaiellaceae bacterium]|nr:hypothetical protein [Gaiellaceae bacterium]
MFLRSLPSGTTNARWTYDDPSGVPEAPLEVSVPEPLRTGIETAAARDGLTPSDWLLSLVSRNLAPPTLKAV